MDHKSGFVSIVGNPNVGKSTLMNVLVGEHLSIITAKAQTTRHRIMGIVSGDDFQIVYSDTPGLLKPHYKLHEAMLQNALSALSDADIVLFITDVEEKANHAPELLEKIKNLGVPVLLLINKIDLTDQPKVIQLIEDWKLKLPDAEVYAISALHKFNVQGILTRISELLPIGEAFFPKDQLTDKSERFFVSEIIREKILLNYEQEIPYSVEVVVEQFITDGNLLRISALVYVERETQKGIIIGKGGLALKKVGTEARKDMEAFFGKKVFLEVFVKVDEDWRNKPKALKNFGYQQ